MINQDNHTPEDLKKAGAAFAFHRKSVGGGGKQVRYPRALIETARDLLAKYPISLVRKELGVSATSIERWRRKANKQRPGRRKVSGVGISIGLDDDFIEVPPLPSATHSVELCLKNGLIVRLPHASPSVIVELCRLL